VAHTFSAISSHPDTRTAAFEISASLEKVLKGEMVGAVVVLASFHHGRNFEAIGQILRDTLAPQAMIGGTARTVFTQHPIDSDRCGLSAFVIAGEKIQAKACALDWSSGPAELNTSAQWKSLLHTGTDHAGVFILADPFSSAPEPILSAMDNAKLGALGGGLLSGSTLPGGNLMIADDTTINSGIVGIGFGGDLTCCSVMSSGCRPIGKPMVITEVRNDLIVALGGRPAAEVARESMLALDEKARSNFAHGLRIGIVIDEYASKHGQGDFLIRRVLGVDRRDGALQVDQRMNVGRTVQFQLVDHETGANDLQLAMDAHELDEDRILGALMSASMTRSPMTSDLPQLREERPDMAICGMTSIAEFGNADGVSRLQGGFNSTLIFKQETR
jgi:small ligand-binding sensory domain FIST